MFLAQRRHATYSPTPARALEPQVPQPSLLLRFRLTPLRLFLLSPHRTQDDRYSDENRGASRDPREDLDNLEFVAFIQSTFDPAYASTFKIS